MRVALPTLPPFITRETVAIETPGFPGYIINSQEIPPVGCNTL